MGVKTAAETNGRADLCARKALCQRYQIYILLTACRSSPSTSLAPHTDGLEALPKSSCKEIGVAAKFGEIVVKLETIDEGIHHSPVLIWPLSSEWSGSAPANVHCNTLTGTAGPQFRVLTRRPASRIRLQTDALRAEKCLV